MARRKAWAVTILRAVNPDGTPIWPEGGGIEDYRRLWQSGGAAMFNAVFQQDPSGLAGEVFHPEWFRYYAPADFVSKPSRFGEAGLPASELLARGLIQAILPTDEKLGSAQGHDLAISKKEAADYYARVNMLSSRAGDLYVQDAYQDRLTTKKMLYDMADAAHRRFKAKVVGVPEEVLEDALLELAAILKVGSLIPWKPIPHEGLDKVTRARPLAAKYENGQVYHLYGARWLSWFEPQMTAFPGGAHDDAVDAAAVCHEAISAFRPGDWAKAAALMEEIRKPNQYANLG
jgi:predicted phage terminase large subunit-like protein